MSHRLLLAAYPARLRRKHGAELIDTMLEMSGPGQPDRAARTRLVLDGLRERFRPPTRSPLAVCAAILALLIGGALGAAAGSWLGTFGYAALPDAGTLLPQADLAQTGDRYLSARAPIPAGTDPRQAAEQHRQRLAAEGWTTGPLLTGPDDVLANVHFSASTEAVRLDVYAYQDGTIDISGWPQRPAEFVPLTVAGLLLGLAAGWLAGVALAHRIRLARRPLRSLALTAVGLLLVIPSAVGFTASLVRYLTIADPLGTAEMVHFRGFAFGPTIDLMRALDMGEGWYLTPSDFQQLPIYGFALIAVAAILARPARDRKAVA